MASNLVWQIGSPMVVLRLSTEMFFQIASIARLNSPDGKRKDFYSHLAFHCIRLRAHDRRALQTRTRLDVELVVQALGHLHSLVEDKGPIASSTGTWEAHMSLLLLSTHLDWDQIPLHDDEAKLEFIRTRLLAATASNELWDAVDHGLESCADALDKQYSEQFSPTLMDLLPSKRIMETPRGIGNAAQSLYDALLDCKRCSCLHQHDFEAKLEVASYRKHGDSSAASLSSKSPRKRSRPSSIRPNVAAGAIQLDMFLAMEQDWHELRIHAANQRQGETTMQPVQRRTSRGKPTKVEHLCMPIAKTNAKSLQRLLLNLTQGQLFEMGFEKTNLRIDKAARPISLSQCFEQRHEFFTEKTKRILSLLMAYAVLHLNGTSWLPPGWGSANINFFQTTASKTPLRPFIQVPLPKISAQSPEAGVDVDIKREDDLDDDASDDLDLEHCCPSVTALAVLLMEIHSATPFRKLAEIHDVPLIEDPSGRICLIDVEQVFNGVEGSDREGWRCKFPDDSVLLKVIENCLDGKLWEDEHGYALDDDTLRSRMHEHVVQPLELDLSYGFSQVPLDSIDEYARNLDFGHWGMRIASCFEPGNHDSITHPLPPNCVPTKESAVPQLSASTADHDFLRAFRPYSQFPTHSPYVALEPAHAAMDLNHRSLQFFDDELSQGQQSLVETRQYLDWKSEYKKVYDKFIGDSLHDFPPNPIKVAILDTGIDRDHYIFEAYEQNFKERRNLHNPSQKNTPDRNGHGTFTANLILDYAPDAALYVIKIVDKGNAPPDAMVVAKAINHAIDAWSVDIISMSFGWPSCDFHGYQALEAAIDRAHNSRVLMFAAASNSGGRLGRAYPASSPHVICVHSTNSYGNASNFSPTAEPNSVNIATIGESVQSAWPMLLCSEKPDPNECVESRSGTSYATPILAGIAAFLLQYARLHLPDVASSLRRKEKMEALLKRCAERGPNYAPRDGFYYVELSLHGHNLFGENVDWVNHEILKALRS